jgi:hypothetical protein
MQAESLKRLQVPASRACYNAVNLNRMPIERAGLHAAERDPCRGDKIANARHNFRIKVRGNQTPRYGAPGFKSERARAAFRFRYVDLRFVPAD